MVLPITMVGPSNIQEKTKIGKKSGILEGIYAMSDMPQKILFNRGEFTQKKKTLPISGQRHQQVNPKLLRFLCLLKTSNAEMFSCH